MLEKVARHLLEKAAHIPLVVETEVLRVAQVLDLFAQKAHAEAVEGAENDLFGLFRREELGNPLAHFCSGFVGKRQAQDGGGIGPLLDEVSDPVDDDLRFAAACPGKDEYTSIGGVNGLLLLFVERHGMS